MSRQDTLSSGLLVEAFTMIFCPNQSWKMEQFDDLALEVKHIPIQHKNIQYLQLNRLLENRSLDISMLNTFKYTDNIQMMV